MNRMETLVVPLAKSGSSRQFEVNLIAPNAQREHQPDLKAAPVKATARVSVLVMAHNYTYLN